jgi:hypothetical protein
MSEAGFLLQAIEQYILFVQSRRSVSIQTQSACGTLGRCEGKVHEPVWVCLFPVPDHRLGDQIQGLGIELATKCRLLEH